jgi:RND family efflux transporter MFP subunit
MRKEDTMNKQILKIAAVCTAAALCSFAACKLPGKKPAQTEKTATIEQVRINVTIAKAERRTLVKERKLLGTLQAYRETNLGPLSPGRVKSLPVQIGDFVKAGQVVAKMDDAQLSTTETQFATLKTQYDRSLSLYQGNALPKSQFESIEAQYNVMKRQIETLRENTIIVTPFAGIVTGRACEEGELYSGGPSGLVHITQLNPLKLDLDLDNETVRYVKKGMKVKIDLDQKNDTAVLYGNVEFVNPQADARSNTFSSRVIVPNNNQSLRPGFYAEVHIVIDQKENALCVPRDAIVDEKVFTISNDSIAISKKITTGWLTNDYAEITTGINESDIVVIKGNKALPDSAIVNIVQ